MKTALYTGSWAIKNRLIVFSGICTDGRITLLTFSMANFQVHIIYLPLRWVRKETGEVVVKRFRVRCLMWIGKGRRSSYTFRWISPSHYAKACLAVYSCSSPCGELVGRLDCVSHLPPTISAVEGHGFLFRAFHVFPLHSSDRRCSFDRVSCGVLFLHHSRCLGSGRAWCLVR